MTTTCSPTFKEHDWPDFVGAWPRLTGRQEPEFESRHPGDESEGDRCAKFGRRIGIRCLPWEWQTLRGILSLRPPDEYGDRVWTHRDVCIECTRQQGKTLIIVLLIIFHLFVLKTRRVVYTAQRWATAEDVFDRVVAVIERVPSLRRRMAAKPTKKDNRGVLRLINGAKAEFGPRSQDFGRGYTEIDLLIHDEAYDLDARETANLEGAQRAAKNPQTLTISTPPVIEEHPKCHRLASMHRLGHDRAPHLFYRLFAAPLEMSRDDPAAYPLAQPSYGVVGNDREMESTRQKAKTAREIAIFDADYMGRGDYPPPENESASEISAESWADMGSTAPKLTGSPVLVLERGTNRKLWLLVAAQHTTDGRVHIEIGYSQPCSDAAIVGKVAAVVTAWNPDAVVIRALTAAAEAQSLLVKAGVEPEMVNSVEVAQFCGGFLDAALDGRLSHSNQRDLDTAVSHAVRKDLPAGGFVWELVDDASFAQLMGASVAHGALLKFGVRRKAMPAAPMSAAPMSGAENVNGHSAEFDVMTSAF